MIGSMDCQPDSHRPPAFRLLLAGVLMLAAHLGTALIQAEPRAVEGWLGLIGEGLPFPPMVPVIMFSAWLAWWLALSNHPLQLLKDAYRTLRDQVGKAAAVFLLGAALLPQRLLDNNSGYTLIEPGSELSLLCLGLDLIRGLCAFAFFHGLVVGPLESALPIESGGEGRRGEEEAGRAPGNRGILAAALVSAGMALLLQHGALHNLPHVEDEIIQDWHARMLASGQVRAAPNAFLRSFKPGINIGDNGERLHSTYQPGLVLIWSVFQRWDRIDLVNPLLAFLGILLFAGLLRTTHGGAVAGRASLLLAASPFLIIMAAGRMNHLLALFLLLVAARGLTGIVAGAPVQGMLLTGLAAGICLMTRRVDAVVLVAAVVTTLLTLPGFDRRRAGILLGIGVLMAVVVTVQMAFSRAHTGNPRQMLDQVRDVAVGWSQVPFEALWQNLLDNLTGFGVYAFGGILAGFMGFAFLRWNGPGAAGLLERFFLIQGVLTLAAYGIYNFQDFCYGPRFLFGLLPGAALGTARMLAAFGRAGGPRAQRWPVLGLAFALLLLVHQGWSTLGRQFWHTDDRFSRFVQTKVQGPALLFLRNPTRIRLQVARALAGRGLARDQVMAATTPDALDYDGLLADLAGASDPERAWGIVEGHLARGRFQNPIRFEVNPWEAVRLNTGDPLRQPVVVALDLGDEENQRLIDALPGHTPWLAACRFGEPFLLPYAPAGVPRF